MFDFTWKDFLAIYAAILSTLVFLWNVRKSRSKFKVIVVHGNSEIDEKIKFGVYVSVQNTSHNVVFINAASVLYPYRRSTFWSKLWHLVRFRNSPISVGWIHTSPSYENIETGLPIVIQPGDSHGFLLPAAALNELTKDRSRSEIRLAIQNAHGQNTYSKKFSIDWLDDSRQKVQTAPQPHH